MRWVEDVSGRLWLRLQGSPPVAPRLLAMLLPRLLAILLWLLQLLLALLAPCLLAMLLWLLLLWKFPSVPTRRLCHGQ